MVDLAAGTGTEGRTGAAGGEPFFAIVIGTGFGGAVTACRLAQACFEANKLHDGPPKQVCVLERGRRYERQDFPRLKLPDYLVDSASDLRTSKRLPDVSRLLWGNDQGLWDLRNLGELRVAQAAGYGGGSLIYANVHLRPPQQVFDDWPKACGADCTCAAKGNSPTPFSRDALDPYFDRVADMLAVQPLPERLRRTYTKTSMMADVATSLAGEHSSRCFIYPPLAVTFETPPDGTNAFGRHQSACTGCGDCTIGCREGAKNTLDLNYLAIAENLGANIRTLADVQTIRHARIGGRDLLRVRYIDHLAPDAKEVFAEYVFLCAGAVGSTEILFRSTDRRAVEAESEAETGDLAPPHDVAEAPFAGQTPPAQAAGPKVEVREIGPLPNLGKRFYANGDNLGVVFDLPQGANPERGPTITTTFIYAEPPETHAEHADGSDEHPDGDNRSHWFLMQDGGIPPSLSAGLGLFRSPLWLAQNRFSAAARTGRSLLDAMIGLVEAAPPYWIKSRSASAPLTSMIAAMLPAPLERLLTDVGRFDAKLRDDLGALVGSVVQSVDERLGRGLLGRLKLRYRQRDAPLDSLVTYATTALETKFPALADLLTRQRPADYVLALGRFLLFGLAKPSHAAMLLCMGPDQCGMLVRRDQHLRIQWDPSERNRGNLRLFTLQERLMRDAARQLGGELRTNPSWTLGRKPLTVHSQGGCGMSASPKEGVTTPCGRVWTCDRLYVFDAAIFPKSVGVNPSATIAAVAERNVELFIAAHLSEVARTDYRRVVTPTVSRATAPSHGNADVAGDPARRLMLRASLPTELPLAPVGLPRARPIGLRWDEALDGYVISATQARASALTAFQKKSHVDEAHFAALERKARATGDRVVAKLTATIRDVDDFLLQQTPRIAIDGSIVFAGRDHPVRGNLHLHLRSAEHAPSRTWSESGQQRLHAMTYLLRNGSGLELLGRKVIRDDPGFDMWSDLSTLYVTVSENDSTWVGVVRVQLADFVEKQLRQLQVLSSEDGGDGGGDIDDVAKAWALMKFGRFFLGSVKNVYSNW